ncbi:hypothetical protein KFK09_004170 [Dendrobium nobile]|uniref:DUF4283 domain-containing protein n=1 Tax=Dendrobium nobile TaxID=94219 RepID=A0A8T3C259_DENNO|nr:hypothetical protein KFK09_004170 [Dendrobium nobile]
MEADGRRPSLASVTRSSSITTSKNQILGGNQTFSGFKHDDFNMMNRKLNGALVIKDFSEAFPKKVLPVEGKGKVIAENLEMLTPREVKSSMILNSNDLAASSSGMKIFVNRFGNSNAITGQSVINVISPNSVNKSLHENDIMAGRKLDINVNKVSDELPSTPAKAVDVNPWSKKPYIMLNFKEEDKVLPEDGAVVKLCEEKEILNSDKLNNSLVIKVFRKELPSHMVAWEIRIQWSQFGLFYFTSLGRGWFLCSFDSQEMTEGVLSGGPWFVNGHIVGIEKWSTDFSPLSMKGLTSPIWIRLPHLPLQCWDEVNVARIASMIGTPLMLDRNMFQWGRREFARVCVRMKLDKCLPLGVWVEGISGRFFLKVEYEKISTFCFGHVKNDCKSGILVNNKPTGVVRNEGLGLHDAIRQEVAADASYGKLIQEKNEDRIMKRSIERSGLIEFKQSNLNVSNDQIEEEEITGDQEQGMEDLIAVETEECCVDDGDVVLVEGEGLGKEAGGEGSKYSDKSYFVLKTLDQCVIGDLNVFNKGVWMISTIYESKEVHRRRLIWDCILEVSHRKVASIVGGDFNCILSQGDKKGGRKFVFSQGPKEMLNFMNDNDLHDVGIVGPGYTWCNNKIGGGRILERLDRCLLNTLAINSIQVACFFQSKWKERVCWMENWPCPKKALNDEDKKWLDADFPDSEIVNVVKILGNNQARGCDAIKLDMEQAYDSMCWTTLRKMMIVMGFPEKFASLVMECILEPRFAILINGDDVMVFSFTKMKNIKKLKSIIEDNCKWTGQTINLQKSTMNKHDGSHGLHYVAWDIMCKPKSLGGWGAYSAKSRMRALRAKFAWDLLERPSTLLNRNLLAKYGEKWWSNEEMKGGSSTWKIIESGWKALKSFVRWNVVVGSKIKVLKYVWILDKCLLKWPTFVANFEDDNGALVAKFSEEDVLKLVVCCLVFYWWFGVLLNMMFDSLWPFPAGDNGVEVG